jgi:uncharacterized protein (DUF2336 family)
MIVQRFLSWVQHAPAGARAEATSALARAYLYSDLDDAERADAETALTTMLDDSSPLVRRALAEAFASAREAPHHCVSALAADQSDIAAIVLSRSPLLGDAELIECAAVGDAYAQSAIALRPGLSHAVASALTEFGLREALVSLAVNPAANVGETALRRMLERFGDDGELREAILSRPDLPASLRADLVAATADALANFVIGREWMPEERARRVTREAVEKGIVTIAVREEERAGVPSLDLARRLRKSGRLTPGLALRALLGGNRGLLESILVELSGFATSRVLGVMNRPNSSAFAALYARAGLPADCLPAFRAALTALETHDARNSDGILSRPLVARVREACSGNRSTPALASTLRQYEAEAARDDARNARAILAKRAAEPVQPRIEIDLAAIEAELAAA